MINTYAQAYVEILEIIKNMEQSYKDKIPKKLVDFFERNKDNNYTYNMDKNQNMIFSQKTIDLLAMLELKYLATETEKKVLKQVLDENDKKYQRELREKYNTDTLFENKQTKVETIQQNSIALIEQKESIFTKVKKWIKRNFWRISDKVCKL